MKDSIIAVLGFALLIVAAPQASAVPAALLDASTGIITISGTGYVGINILTTNANLIPANGNATAGNGATTYDVSLAPNILSWLDFAGFPDPVNLGNIVPVGVCEGISFQFVDSSFGGDGALEVINCVPEPTTMMLTGLGLAGVAAFLRRRVLPNAALLCAGLPTPHDLDRRSPRIAKRLPSH